MPLSWNEIKSRAVTFSKKWEDTKREEADAKEFLVEFLNIFGVERKKVATFEHKVKKLSESAGYIDLLWPGMLLVEMKSRGENLEKAYNQAKEYCHGLADYNYPKFILICDFNTFHLYDENADRHDFTLSEVLKNVRLFSPIAGYQKVEFKEQDPVNIKAAELMGKLHDQLEESGYVGHELELFLVRLLFCLFADDTTIFDQNTFHEFIATRTHEDGSDLGQHLDHLFQVLNKQEDKRQKTLDEQLAAFPYVNGKLFEERLTTADFNKKMRDALLDCCKLDWSKISPAIFGSLFQSVMNPIERRNLGAHYTSEKNILKVIKPLFLDGLWKEFEGAKFDKRKLKLLHHKITQLRFLDPACGCGNFLIIAYHELRLLELEIVKIELKGQQVTNVNEYFLIDVDQFYGIEYEEFPSQISQVAMWLMDHQMNGLASLSFGKYFKRIPLVKSATIKHGNALQVDWQSLIELSPSEKEAQKFNFIFGNPPFIGKQYQTPEQKADMDIIFHGVNGAGLLDYVTAWYIKAAKYMQEYNFIESAKDTSIDLPLRRTRVQYSNGHQTKAAFVSTNSISQGEQVGVLWSELFNKYKIKIHFAHRTFSWRNEARGNAAVHVVIIGFANFDVNDKVVYEYENIKAEPHELKVKNINPYLIEGKDNFLQKRRTPICKVEEMVFGNMPNDGGHLIFTNEEKEMFLQIEPGAKSFMKQFIGSQEFLNGNYRWCLWLKDASPTQLKALPEVVKRIEMVKNARSKSNRPTTQKLANTPALFGEVRQPSSDYIVFPEVSTERRKFIPVGFISKEIITSNKNYTVASPSLYVFAILSSTMHMSWVRSVAGRMKSDYSYSTGIVYNNFPWAENPSDKQKQIVEEAAQKVLDARAQFPEASLADLYDPNTMPPVLVKAHLSLDKAVDLCYRSQPFQNETKRIEFLFELYDKYTAGLFVIKKKQKNG
jgi:type I restriction-modification system DNA methylase subunit